MSQYLGDISAYALAVSQGYTGTEEEYAELMASYATVGQTAVTAAQTATTKASEAATSATTATNKATEATTAATTATNKAAEAQADADAAALDASQALSAASTATSKATEATTAAATATSAKTDAVAANTAAQSAKTAAQTAQAGAETAAASVQSSAAQIQTNADDISELKEDLSDLSNVPINTIANTFINKTTGLATASNGYVASDYIPINGSVWLYSFCGNDNSGYGFYDEAKNPLSYGGIYSINRTWTKLTAPTGAKFFRASCGVNQASEFAVKVPASDNVVYLLGKEQTNTLEGILYDGGYRINNAGKIGNFIENSSYVSVVLIVHKGETYHITGRGVTSARLWSTHDTNGDTVRMADSDYNATSYPFKITIAEGERYLVFNSYSSVVYGITMGDASRSTVFTRNLALAMAKESVANVNVKMNVISYTFRNNLSTDGADKLPDCMITKNGVTSKANYGLSGSKYAFTMPSKKLHLYCEIKQDEAIASAYGSPVSKRIVNAFSNGYFNLVYGGSLFLNGELHQAITLRVVSGSNSKSLTLNTIAYKRFQGEDAFSIEYTNTVTANSVCTVSFTDTSIVVNVDGTETTLAVSSTESVADIVDAINGIDGISAEVIVEENKTYGDLLPVVSKSTASSTDIDLIYNGTLNGGTSYTDALKVYIPLAVSHDWHSIELIYNPDGDVVVAFDGITIDVEFNGTSSNTYLVLNYDNAAISMRNLIVDYDGMGDAEVVDNLVDPSITSPSKQLVSSHNPRVLIYEGHGVDIGSDADMPITDNMACSTERLRILFSTAMAKGYVPVSWQDIIDWKLTGKPLPKKCFNIMFDDWKFANFIDYDKRKPFVDFGVQAGLAVITNDTTLSDTVTINGKNYTGEQCVDIVKTAGWYPVSHTHAHRRITDYTPSANADYFKEDVLEADLYNIHSNVLVYPYGEIAQQYMPVIAHSGFAIAINVVKNWYNCRGTNNYNMCRVELGTRVPLSTVLYPLV